MPRPKTGDKRAAILRAATDTIAEDGIGASTAKIAKAAGVAEGSLFRYFSDKDTLLNELYVALKLDMGAAMITGFPATGSLRKRLRYIWEAFIGWGMESPTKRRTMLQLNVSDRITGYSRGVVQVGMDEAMAAMAELAARGRLKRMPPGYASDLLLAMAETTMTAMALKPVDSLRYREVGFEAFWNAAAKK
jgi:AcrR family transcriptional regulator